MQSNLPSFLRSMMPSGMKQLLNHRGQKILPSAQSDRKCVRCSETKSLTSENFKQVKYFRFGYSYYCNVCDEEMRKTGK